jgi:hypothetical protein
MGQGKLEPSYSIHKKTTAHCEWRDGESGTYPPGKVTPKRGGVLSGGGSMGMVDICKSCEKHMLFG